MYHNHLAFIAVILIVVLMPFQALAQNIIPPNQFRPVQVWQNGTKLNGECAMKTKFDNGFILQINGASNWVQQLNINFRQNVFEVGESYTVTLSIPGTMQREFPATAYEPSVLSANVKGEKDFYKSLRQSAVLDFKMDANDFRFYLTGFGAAADSFERCLAGQNVNPAQVQANIPPARQEPSFLTNESIALEANERPQDTALKAGAPVTQRTKPLVPPPHNPRREQPQRVNTVLDVPPIPKGQDLQEPVAQEPMIAKFIPEESRVEAKSETQQASLMTPPIVEKERVQQNIKIPPVKVTKTVSKGEVDFSSRGAETQDHNALLARISVLEKQAKSLRTENTTLKADLEKNVSADEERRLSISSENWNLEKVTKLYNESERQVKRIGQQLQKERTQCDFEKQELEALLFDPEVTQDAQLAKLTTLEQDLSQAQSRIQTLEAQIGSQ